MSRQPPASLRDRAIESVTEALERQFFRFGGHDRDRLRDIATLVVDYADEVALSRMHDRKVGEV